MSYFLWFASSASSLFWFKIYVFGRFFINIRILTKHRLCQNQLYNFTGWPFIFFWNPSTSQYIISLFWSWETRCQTFWTYPFKLLRDKYQSPLRNLLSPLGAPFSAAPFFLAHFWIHYLQWCFLSGDSNSLLIFLSIKQARNKFQ